MNEAQALFEGEPGELPSPIPRGFAVYREGSQPEPVRHIGGYQVFVDFCVQRGASPSSLAVAVPALLAFLRSYEPEVNADGGMARAASIFLGNALAQARRDAVWSVLDDGAQVGNNDMQFPPGTIVARIGDATDQQFEELLRTLREWESEEPHSPVQFPVPRNRRQSPVTYVRPEMATRTYTDDEGVAIDYGQRWGDEPAPEESYEVVSHPERYAGLHHVADALIAYLTTAYDAVADGGGATEAGAGPRKHGERTETCRTVRVSPSGADSAPLTFEFTDFPGVLVRAGVLGEFAFPDCGCDACDSSVEGDTENLEKLVFAVVEGNFRESYPVGRRRWYEYALTYAGALGSERSQSSQGGPPPVSEEKLDEAESRLASLGEGWQPWPLRRNP